MGKVTHRWSGQVMEPVDYLGFVGRNAGDSTAISSPAIPAKGITNGVIAALLISDLIVDGNSPWAVSTILARTINKRSASSSART